MQPGYRRTRLGASDQSSSGRTDSGIHSGQRGRDSLELLDGDVERGVPSRGRWRFKAQNRKQSPSWRGFGAMSLGKR